MNVTEKKLENATIELEVSIPAEVVNKEYDNVWNMLQRTAKVDGFRKGKVPMSMLQQRFAGDAEQKVVENLVKKTYSDALKEKNINPVTYPEVDFDSSAKPDMAFTYRALVEVSPSVNLGSYSGIQVEEKQVKIKDEDIQKEIDHMKDQQAVIKPAVDGASIEDGNQVIAEVARLDNLAEGQPENAQRITLIAAKKGDDHELGTHVLGMKVEDEKKVTVKYPKDYHMQDLAGNKAEYRIRIVSINTRELPAENDEFAKSMGEYSSMQDLKDKTRQNLEKYVQQRCRAMAKSEILDKIVSSSNFEISKSVISNEAELIFNRMQQRYGFQIESVEKFCAMMGMDQKEFEESLKKEGQKSLQTNLVIAEIIKKENLMVSDEKYEEALSGYAEKMQKSVDEVKQIVKQNNSEGNIKSELLYDVAMDFIYEKAKVKQTSPISMDEFMKTADR